MSRGNEQCRCAAVRIVVTTGGAALATDIASEGFDIVSADIFVCN